jgi:integrase
MPYVVKHPTGRSPYWYAVYRDETGRRLKKSTKLTSRSAALKMAHALERATEAARMGALTETRARELLSEILQRVTGEGLRMVSIADWFDHVVKQKEKSRADKTGQRYAQTLNEFVGFLGSRARLNIATVTSPDIAEFRDRRQSLGLAPSTINGDVTILSAAFNAALRQGHISVNPCLAIEPVKDRAAARKETFTPDQVAALVRVADTDDWKGLILVGFYCGARLCDCSNLRWQQINLDAEIKTIRFQQGKTGREVVMVIHPALEKFLATLRKRRKIVPLTSRSDVAYVFPSLAGRTADPLSKYFRHKIMEPAGIQQRVIRERDAAGSGRVVNALTFHSLRHTFNSILANAGIAEETRMALTGHTTREMNQRYTHRQLSIFQDAVSVLPGI